MASLRSVQQLTHGKHSSGSIGLVVMGEVGRYQICGAKWKTRATRLGGSHFNRMSTRAPLQSTAGSEWTVHDSTDSQQLAAAGGRVLHFKHEFESFRAIRYQLPVPDAFLIVIRQVLIPPVSLMPNSTLYPFLLIMQRLPSRLCILTRYNTKYRYSVPRLAQRPAMARNHASHSRNSHWLGVWRGSITSTSAA